MRNTIRINHRHAKNDKEINKDYTKPKVRVRLLQQERKLDYCEQRVHGLLEKAAEEIGEMKKQSRIVREMKEKRRTQNGIPNNIAALPTIIALQRRVVKSSVQGKQTEGANTMRAKHDANEHTSFKNTHLIYQQHNQRDTQSQHYITAAKISWDCQDIEDPWLPSPWDHSLHPSPESKCSYYPLGSSFSSSSDSP